MKSEILKLNQQAQWSERDIALIFQGIERQVRLIMSSYELFKVSKAEFERDDLIDSIKLFLKKERQ